MANLKTAPTSAVSHVDDMSYVDSVFEADRRIMAILELSPHEVVAQRVAKSLHFGQPEFLESEEYRVDICSRDAVDADLPAIVDIGNQSIPVGWSRADTPPITFAGRVEWFCIRSGMTQGN